MECFPRDLILNQKIEVVKLYEHTIIKGKTMNREQISSGSGNMKDVTEIEILNMVTNNGSTNMGKSPYLAHWQC
jgi:hypothetical protein